MNITMVYLANIVQTTGRRVSTSPVHTRTFIETLSRLQMNVTQVGLIEYAHLHILIGLCNVGMYSSKKYVNINI